MNKTLALSGAVLAAAGIVAGGAVAGTTTSQTMPVRNVTGVNAGVMNVQKAVPVAKLGGPASSYFYLSNGGGQVTISKMVTKGFNGSQSVTITPPSGSTIIQGFATISGGDLGAMVIRSTQLGSGSYRINLAFPGEQGRNGTLTWRLQLSNG